MAGCECGSDEPPVAQPTPVNPFDKPASRTAPPKIPPTNVPLNIRSNAQVVFQDVKIGAGNFEPASVDKDGKTRTPATAKLWTAVKGDPNTATVTQVKVGDSFTVGSHRFVVTAINIPPIAANRQTFEQAGGNKATITVLAKN